MFAVGKLIFLSVLLLVVLFLGIVVFLRKPVKKIGNATKKKYDEIKHDYLEDEE